MNIIVATDLNFGIGKNNALLARIPQDMKRFKELTTGNVCVMGKNTYLSIPSRPLPDRTTLLLTSSPDDFLEVECFPDTDTLLTRIKALESNGKMVYICGGEMVYKALLPYCEGALVTRIHDSFDADTFFPNLENLKNWKITEKTEQIETNGFKISFIDYINEKPALY